MMNMKQKRLHEVRFQEKLIAEEKCRIYRQKLFKMKLERQNEKRQQKSFDLIKKVKDIECEWSKSLLHIAESHFASKAASDDVNSHDHVRRKVIMKNEEMIKQRERFAYYKLQNVADEKKKLEVKMQQAIEQKNQFISVDRENAKASAESKRYFEKLASFPVITVPPVINNQIVAQQSALAIHLRGQHPVNIKIIRHGHREHDKSSIVSQVDEEVKETIFRMWSRVMNELLISKKTRDRELIAKKVLHRNSSASLLEQGLDHLQNEDRTIDRLSVPRNLKVVAANTEDEKVLKDFEKMFNLPTTSNSNMNYEEFASFLVKKENIDPNPRNKSLNHLVVVKSSVPVPVTSIFSTKPKNFLIDPQTEKVVQITTSLPTEQFTETGSSPDYKNAYDSENYQHNIINANLMNKHILDDSMFASDSIISDSVTEKMQSLSKPQSPVYNHTENPDVTLENSATSRLSNTESTSVVEEDRDTLINTLLSSLGISDANISMSNDSIDEPYHTFSNNRKSPTTSDVNDPIIQNDFSYLSKTDTNSPQTKYKFVAETTDTITPSRKLVTIQSIDAKDDINLLPRKSDNPAWSMSAFKLKSEDSDSSSSSYSNEQETIRHAKSGSRSQAQAHAQTIPMTEQSLESFIGIVERKAAFDSLYSDRVQDSDIQVESVSARQSSSHDKERPSGAFKVKSEDSDSSSSSYSNEQEIIRHSHLTPEPEDQDEGFDESNDVRSNMSIISDKSFILNEVTDIQKRIVFR